MKIAIIDADLIGRSKHRFPNLEMKLLQGIWLSLKTLDIDIKGNDDAHNLAKSIEKGLKATKIDTSGLSKQLADAFNITDKSAISKLKGQINSVMSELSKTWNGKEFNLQGGKGNAFISGLSDLANSVSQNANIIQGKMGIYDQFYSYFKDKKIYVSDDLKKALSGDDYKELLNNNIGHIVREASKGVSIDSIWGEMTSMFPEHFADNIVTQADQIKRAFEVNVYIVSQSSDLNCCKCTDENAINSYLSSIDNLFTRNEDGERAGLNIEEFCKNAMDKGLMVLDEAGENYQVAGGKTMEDFAEGMNLSMPMVQAMFGEMQEFGANFDWSDEGIQTMGDIAVAATEASEALRSVAGNEDLKINLDVSDLQTTEEKCSALDDTISEMNSVKAKVGVDSSEVDQANTIIQYCVAQKQQLEAPAVMNVDVSQVSGKIGEAVGLLQEFQTAQNTLQMQETLGMDTSEAQANVEAVADKIKGLDTNVKATLSIDDSSIDTIQDSISNKLNTKGELAYMKKANSVAEKYTYYNSDGGEINVPIPKKYQKLVQSGAYHIEDMDTSTDEGKALAEAISEYQSWYEKAQDCKQAVIDLRNEQQKLFEQWANMPTEKAEKKIDRLTTGYNGINAVSSRLTAATKGGSTQAVLAQTMKEDLAEAQDQKKSDNKALKSAKTANKKASSEKRKADNKVKSTAKSLLKTNLTDEQKKQVKSGKKLDTTGMSGSQKKKADAYNKAVTNKSKANKKATSAKSKLSTAKSNYNSSNSTYNSMKSNVNEALTAYDSGDSLSYMNSLVDQQVSGKKLEQNARKTAVEQANANVATANKQKKEADKKFAKLQKKYKNSKKLTAAQKKKIAAGKEIDTTGITDAKQLKILTAYNNALADSKKKKENVTIATNALAEANENLMTAEVESAQATVEAVSTKFDNAKTYYEALLSYQEQLSKYQEKNIDLAKAHGDYEKSSDYDTKISNTQAEMAIKQNELDELTKQLDDGVEAGTIVENSQEWLDMQTKIKEAQNAVADYDTQIEELKQSQIGVYYEEQFKRAAEKVDRFRDKLDGLKSLISDDMKIDKNTGLLTESGALSITLDVDDINASTENLKTYIKERQQIINDYNAGKFGEDEYNQKLKDVDANIKSTTANIYSSRNSILELVKSQSQAELDVLNKVIDKRKEALSAKKSYYDYDKTLKNKTKDIEVLERQIAALEGSTSAEDKARKAKLQEQLDSAKEDLNDTITDHAYSMQTDALDKLSADMSEDLDKWINTISSNMEEMTTAINDAVKNAGLSTAGTINAISSILRHYRLSDSEISQSGLTNITGYASGTNYVNKSGIYRVNEKGMESVFSKQYGTLTFLNQGDKVFDANFTKQLLDNSTIATQKNMPDYAGMAKAIEKNIQNIQNLSGNTYVNNFYIDGAQDTESILREIDKHLDKKIQAHDKKQVRDFKSLR